MYWSKSISVTYKEIQSFFKKILEKKLNNIDLSTVCYLLIWEYYCAHSASLYTICKREGMSVFVTYIQKNIVETWS